MIPAEFRNSGFIDYLTTGMNWAKVVAALREDEFALDVTRLTLVCGSAGFDGTQFKNMLAADYDIQLNKTSRNSVLLQTNINNTRSDIAQLIDRKSTRLNSSHLVISYAVFCLKKKKSI